MRFSIVNADCMGTTYDQAWIVRESESLGSPSSRACLRAFVHGWTRCAGWPKLVRCDRGTHRRGVFGSTLSKNGVVIRPAGLEATAEQIGRVERRGAMLKKDDVESHQGHARFGQRAVNEITRHGGFARFGCIASRCRWTNNLRGTITLPSKSTRSFRTMGLQTCRCAKGRTRGRILPSRRHCLVLQRSTSRRTRTTMERWFQIDRFREGQKQPR